MLFFTNQEVVNHPRTGLSRRNSRSEQQVTGNGDILEIAEGTISGAEDVIVTNVTIHVVGPNDEKGVLMK